MFIREIPKEQNQINTEELVKMYAKPLLSWISQKEYEPKRILDFQVSVLTSLETYLFCCSKVLLNLDTGLGKTFITLILVSFHPQEYLSKTVPILIIAPASNLLDPWCKEIEEINKSLDKKFKFYVYHGSDKDILNVNGKLHLEGYDFVLVSYQTLESDTCNDYFFNTEFNLIVYDEPQTIINPKKENSTLKKLEMISGKRRLALTASPISNSINEFFILSTLLNNPADIGKAYDELKNLKDKNEIERRAKRNTQIISVSKFEKSVSEQMKLQPLMEYKIVLPVPDIIKNKLKELKSNSQRTLLLEKPEAYFDKIPADNSFDSKTKAAELILSTIPESQKTIIFSMHTECLDKLYLVLSRKYECFKVVGGMTQKERARIVDNFKCSNGQAVMLASLKANSTGLNYQESNNEIFMDSWYNPEVMKQARDRCFRMGQKRTTIVFYLTTDTEHENNIHKIKDSKTKIKKETFSLETESEPTTLDLSKDSNYLDKLKEYIGKKIFIVNEKTEDSIEENDVKPFKLPKKDNHLHINFIDDEENL